MTSFLGPKGAPGVAQRTLIRPPSSQLGPLHAPVRHGLIDASPLAGKYDRTVDRESAYEMLKERAEAAAREAAAGDPGDDPGGEPGNGGLARARRYDPAPRSRGRAYGGAHSPSRGGSDTASLGEEISKVVIKELKGTTGRRIVRGILGTIFRAR